MGAIVTEQLTKRYGSRVGVDGLTLTVPEGVLFGFLGPNGSGKTTTIRVLLGFLRPSEGGARVLGRDCWREAARIKEEVGYLPGDLRLYSQMTGDDLLRIVGAVRRRDLLPPGRALAERFALDLTVTVRAMSRGMRQKIGLILALAPRPRLLVLDEPTASLDPLMQDQLIQHLRELAAAGHTVFFSSHTLSEVERLCDRVAILREGRLVAAETVETLRADAGRQVTITWAKDADLSSIAVPPTLAIRLREDRTWRGNLTGPAVEFIKWASGQPIEDLSVGQPDLETLFRHYYERGASTS